MRNSQSFVLLLLLMAILFSCQKEPNFEGADIAQFATYYDDNTEAKNLFIGRLCLAKMVAKAFEDREFTLYFKNNFGVHQEKVFQELLVAQHLKDKVKADGTTFEEHLNRQADSEVRGFYESNPIIEILEGDPMVVIKLPNVFWSLNWDIDKARPVAIPLTPTKFKFNENWDRYIAYHFSGNVEYTAKLHSYFFVSVKYSEDNFLLDKQGMVNEKGISFYEILPQSENCPDGFMPEINQISEPFYLNPAGMVVVPKLKAFELWREKYGYRGTYFSRAQDCTEPCKRYCTPLSESRLIADSFYIIIGNFYEKTNFLWLEESSSYIITLWEDYDFDFIKTIALPAIPFALSDSEPPIAEWEHQNLCDIPRVKTERWKGIRRDLPIHAVMRENVLPTEKYYIRLWAAIYSDQVEVTKLDGSIDGTTYPSFTSHATVCESFTSDFTGACHVPKWVSSYINVKFDY